MTALLAGLEMATILFIHWWWQLQSLGCTWILQLQRSAANFSFFNRSVIEIENYLEFHQHCQQEDNLLSQAEIAFCTELLLLWEKLSTRWSNRAGKTILIASQFAWCQWHLLKPLTYMNLIPRVKIKFYVQQSVVTCGEKSVLNWIIRILIMTNLFWTLRCDVHYTLPNDYKEHCCDKVMGIKARPHLLDLVFFVLLH